MKFLFRSLYGQIILKKSTIISITIIHLYPLQLTDIAAFYHQKNTCHRVPVHSFWQTPQRLQPSKQPGVNLPAWE